MLQLNKSLNQAFFYFIAVYLLREIKKADIPLPEGDVNPVAPLPKHVMLIMVSSILQKTLLC